MCFKVVFVLGVLTAFGMFIIVWDANRVLPPIDPLLIENDGGHAFILPDGRLLEYFDFGDFHSDVVVGQHGGVTTGKGFEPGLPEWRVIAPTYPGFGCSTPDFNGTMLSYGQDVALLLKHLGIKRVVVVGGSWGGSLGLSIAYSTAKLGFTSVRGVLIGAPAMPKTPDFPGFSSMIVEPTNYVIQHYLMPSPLGPVIVKYLYTSMFQKDPAELFATFGEKPFPDMYKMVEDMRRSIRWSFFGQPNLLKIGTTTRHHFDFADISAVLSTASIRVWNGDADEQVPAACSQYLVDKLKQYGHTDVTLTLVQNGTHFWIRNIVGEPLKLLMEELRNKNL